MPRTLAEAQLQGKCPRCRQGDIFKYPLRNIFRFSAMHKICPVCEANFEPEPGFYFGAMFVSYAISVTIFVVIAAALFFLVHPPEIVYLITILTVIVLFIPASFRYSRILWLYWFGGYHFDERRFPGDTI